MASVSGDDLSSFSGQTRLFPLPGFVMMPGVKKMFHLFEPRYRQLAADAVAGDGLITLVQLRDGWEGDYEGQPPTEAIGCLCRIDHHTRLPDGRFLLLLRGVCRVRLEREQLTSTPYRVAQAQPLPDAAEPDVTGLRDELVRAALRQLPEEGAARTQIRQLCESTLPVGSLCDVLSFYLPVEPSVKQELLNTLDVAARCRRLLSLLTQPLKVEEPPAEAAEPRRRPPPDFSLN